MAPITAVDRFGTHRIVTPATSYHPSQVDPTPEQIEAAEERNARWAEQEERSSGGIGLVHGDGPVAAPSDPLGHPVDPDAELQEGASSGSPAGEDGKNSSEVARVPQPPLPQRSTEQDSGSASQSSTPAAAPAATPANVPPAS